METINRSEQDQVELCKGDACFRANGKNAQWLTATVIALLAIITLAMAIKILR